METIEINRNSWHFKLVTSEFGDIPPSAFDETYHRVSVDSCQYNASIIKSILRVICICVIAALFAAGCSLLLGNSLAFIVYCAFNGFVPPTNSSFVGTLILASILIAAASTAAIAKISNYIKSINEDNIGILEQGAVRRLYDAAKNRYCKKIALIEETK